MMPPRGIYIETHLGSGVIMKRKAPALHNIGIDLDRKALGRFACDYLVQRVHGCPHEFVAAHDCQGLELISRDSPYLRRMRTSARRYGLDYQETDHY